jgi:hemerythrin
MDQARTIKALIDCGALSAALHLEHQAIENSLQALSDALFAGAPTETLTEIIDIVLDFCVAHFQSEEREFRDHVYAGAAAHSIAHEKMLGALRDVRTAISEGHIDATLEAGELINGFHYHVSHFDRPACAQLLRESINRDGETLQRLTELDRLTPSSAVGA